MEKISMTKEEFGNLHHEVLLGIKGAKSGIMAADIGATFGGDIMPDVTYRTPKGRILVRWRENKVYGWVINLGEVELDGKKIKLADLPGVRNFVPKGDFDGVARKFSNYIYNLCN